MPWRRLRRISSRCRSSGRPLTSTTLSSMRVKTRTTSRYSFQSKSRLVRERLAHEARQVDRAEQARAVGRQRLLAAGVGGADVLAPPVVVHLVDAVDQDEARLGEVVGRRHDDVPHAARRQRLVDLAAAPGRRHARRSCSVRRPLAPDELRRRRRACARPGRIPCVSSGKARFQSRVLAHRLHEFVGDQQREIELAQAARSRAWRG